MDGTGVLFETILPALEHHNVSCLSLPDNGPQDYQTLAQFLENYLPQQDFILVAESFSGGIAAVLSTKENPHLKGIIFVAAFLSAPNKLVAAVASYLPLRQLTQLPFASLLFRFFLLGKNATTDDIECFKFAVKSTPNKVLQSRLQVISKCSYDGFKSAVPVVHITAIKDMLVPAHKRKEFKAAYSAITFVEVDGPHFLLQVQPKAAAIAIIKAVGLLTSNGRA